MKIKYIFRIGLLGFIYLLLLVSISCTTLTPQGAKVISINNSGQLEGKCERVGDVRGYGPNDNLTEALIEAEIKAKNEAGKLGANYILITKMGEHLVLPGSIIEGIAYKCSATDMSGIVNAEVYVNLANSWFKKKQYDQAIKDCTRAIELAPSNTHAYTIRGNALLQKKQYDQAIKDCNRAIELAPSNTNAYMVRGQTWFQKKQYDQAINDFDKAMELGPGSVGLYYNMGCVYSRKKNKEKALKYLELAFMNGLADFNIINKDPDWDIFRDTHAFKLLIKKYENKLINDR